MMTADFLKERVAAIATMHGKERAIAPILAEKLAIRSIVPPNFNTDRFGTFTREIKRKGTQIETARLKAIAAIELTGETLAIASEGSFGPHPAIPFLPSNREVVLLYDRTTDLEVIGEAISTKTNYSHRRVSSVEEALEFAEKIGFPEHGLVAIVGDREKEEIFKGINDSEQLAEIIETGLARSADKKVHLETDMRAHFNPLRLQAIEQATLDLIRKLGCSCPECNWPGFDVVECKAGLPCEWCNLPTALMLAEIHGCKKCGFKQEVLFPEGRKTANPGECHYCNP